MAVFMAEGKALTLKQVAERLSVSERTVTRLAEDGDLTGYKVGHSWRFEPAALKDFIEKQTEKKQQKDAVEQAVELLSSLSNEQLAELRVWLTARLEGHSTLTATLTLSTEQAQ